MSLKLPQAPGAYDKGDQAQMRGAVERADLQNRKRQEDLVLGPGQGLVFYDEHGAEQRYTGTILGGLVRSDMAAQGLTPAEQANARANIAAGSGAGMPGGSAGQVQFNNGGGFGGFTVGGDASLNVLTGALSLAAVNTDTGVFGDATHVGQVAVNAKGLVTAASSVAIPTFTSSTAGFVPPSGGGTTHFLRADGTFAAPPGGSGTVTSVALSLPADFTVSATPVTASGTLTATYAPQSANLAFAGPTAGTAAVPTFRALVAADIPAINLSASGAGGVMGNLPVSRLNGGVGATSATFWNGSGAWVNPSTPGTIAFAGDILAETKPTGTLVTKKIEWLGVGGSASQTVLDYSGSGYVTSLFVGIGYSNSASIDGGVINIYYDGEVNPTISTTFPQFFQMVYMRGSAAPNAYFNTKYFGCNFNGTTATQAAFYITLPMPFSSRIKIDVVNGSGTAITLWSVATVQTGVANTWPRTRKLRVTTQFIDSPTANSTQIIANAIGKGRLVGLWMLSDDFPHTMNPTAAEWEGNFRFYADIATKTWGANTAFANGDVIIDTNGNKQTVTAGGTSGGTSPTWSQASGGATTDGGVTWTQTPGMPNQVWLASRPFALNMAVLDSNGYVQRVTTAGTTGGSAPSFNSTPGGTTTDGSVTWTNQGSTYAAATYQSGGAEDYFMMGFYGAGVPANTSSNGVIGTTFCNASPLTSSSLTRSFYRYHLDDPIVFDTSLVITWQAGDTSQVSWTSGSPRTWINAYYYTES